MKMVRVEEIVRRPTTGDSGIGIVALIQEITNPQIKTSHSTHVGPDVSEISTIVSTYSTPHVGPDAAEVASITSVYSTEVT